MVRTVTVGSGVTLKRVMPRARGSAYRIEKKTSHIDLILTEREPSALREGKRADLVTKKVDELSMEELSGSPKERAGKTGATDVARAVRPATPAKSARQPFSRRGGDA